MHSMRSRTKPTAIMKCLPAVFLFACIIMGGALFSIPSAYAAHSITVAPSSGQVDQGISIHFVITAAGSSSGDIGFNINGLPSGANATFLTGSCAPTCSTIVTIITACTATTGTHSITAEGGIVTDTASMPYTLTITDATQPASVASSITQT